MDLFCFFLFLALYIYVTGFVLGGGFMATLSHVYPPRWAPDGRSVCQFMKEEYHDITRLDLVLFVPGTWLALVFRRWQYRRAEMRGDN